MQRKNTTHALKLFTLFTGLMFSALTFAQDCPAWLNHDFNKLRSDETVNLCELGEGKVMVLVNTASNCGFTKQFSGLEKLYQKYKDQGLVLVGFPSDDFFQENDEEKDIATVCYINYGVTFTMLEPSHVWGGNANPVFAHLGDELGAPKWNFYKYLIDRQGQPVEYFGSRTKPLDSDLEQAIRKALGLE